MSDSLRSLLSIILGQAALSSVEYEDHIRNEAEIKQKVGRLEKDLKVTIRTNLSQNANNNN